MKRCFQLIGIALLLVIGLSAFNTPKKPSEPHYIWLGKKYETDKVYVVTQVLKTQGEPDMTDVLLSFKQAVTLHYGTDQNGNVKIDAPNPRKNKDAVERSRDKQIDKLKKDGWRILIFRNFDI